MQAIDQPKQRRRAGGYGRISSDPKDKRAGVTRQTEDVGTMCEVLDWDLVEMFVDNDRSASNGRGRPDWERLLSKIETGELDAIVVWNQDRGWRKMADLESLRPLLEPRGVLLATTNIGVIDFRNADDVFRAQVSTALSEMEIAKMKVRMRRAARQRAEQGRPKWRKAFGYLDMGDDQRDLDPTTAPLVKQAYTAILAGSSLKDIAGLFNDAGAYGLNGKPWTESTVSLFLRAPRNAGLRAHNGEFVGKGTWPALVPESTWRAAQDKLNAPGRAPGRKSVRKHLLTGVLRCGKQDCDGYLSGTWVMHKTGGKSGRPKAGRKKEPHSGKVAHSITYACKSCRGVAIRAAQVEPLLYGLVGGRLARPDAVDLLKAEIHDEGEAEQIRAELNILYGELGNIGVERGQGLLTGQQAKIATDIVSEKIAKLERRQQDQQRLQVFEDIPLGTPEAVAAVQALSSDRFRAVVDMLMEPTVAPVGKRGHVFNPERVKPNWR